MNPKWWTVLLGAELWVLAYTVIAQRPPWFLIAVAVVLLVGYPGWQPNGWRER